MQNASAGYEMHKSVCLLCFQVCGINAYVKDGKLEKVEGMKEHPFSRGVLCPRGYHLPNYVYSPDRLKFPMSRGEDGRLHRVSWDEALDTVADKLLGIKEDYGARAISLSVGSKGAEDIEISAFAQRFRGALGTPNFFSIEGHCFRSRIMARQMTFGTYPLSDPDNADCIILWGHNPDASEPPLAERIRSALNKGLKLIVIDPRRIPLAKEGIYLQIHPGTDCALALAMVHVILEEALYDKEFVESYTFGFDQLAESVQSYRPEKVAPICGVSAPDIYTISRMFATARRATIEEGIASLNQQINGFQNSRAFAILQTVTGNYNKPGTWCTNPFMRLSDLRLPVEEKPIGADEYPMFHKLWGRVAPYGQQMLFPDVILTQKPYPVKALLVNGGNPAAAWPDSEKIKKAFKNLDLLVVMDLFMTDTARCADVILPATSSVERLGIAYNYGLTGGMPFAMLSRKLIEPLGECRPDWMYFSELGRKMGYAEHFPWRTEEEMIEHLLAPSKITLKQLLEHPEGVWFGERSADMSRETRTPSGKIEIYSQTLAEAGYDPLPKYVESPRGFLGSEEPKEDYPLTAITGVRIPVYSGWQMRSIPPLRKLAPEPIVEIHPATAREFEIGDGEELIVETPNRQIRLKAWLTEDIKVGLVGLPHGWEDHQNANVLTSLQPNDPVTGYPAHMNHLPCRIRRAERGR